MDKKTTGKRLWQIVCNLDLSLATVFLLVLGVITFLGVIWRYIIGMPFTWLEEVQLALLVWIGFLAASAAFRSGSHIAIEMVVEILPAAAQRVIEWLVRVVVTVILAFLTVQCTGYMRSFMQSGRLSPVLRVPYWCIYSVPALCCATMLIGYLAREFCIVTNRTPKEAADE